MSDNIFQKFLFQTKFDFVRIFSHDFYLTNLCQYLLSLFFSKDSRFQKCLLFFYPRLKLLWSRVQQNNPDEKSVGDSQTFESNRGQQWLSRTGQIKICQGCSWGQNFDWFLREKKEIFLIVCPMARAAGWKKRTNGLFDRPQRVIRKLNDFN